MGNDSKTEDVAFISIGFAELMITGNDFRRHIAHSTTSLEAIILSSLISDDRKPKIYKFGM
jgi:hypothetical protein